MKRKTRGKGSRGGRRRKSDALVQSRPRVMEWDSFLPEIQMSILSLLPASDVIRLRAVSKSWRSLLCDPAFVALHSTRGASVHYLLHKEPCPVFGARFYSSDDASLQLHFVSSRWNAKFWPLNTRAFASGGGLLLSIKRSYFWVSNPVTGQRVRVPPVAIPLAFHNHFLMPYTSEEGQIYFRIWIEPYFFDSKVGVWRLPAYKTTWTASYNVICIAGVWYALGICSQHAAMVLLEFPVDDPCRLSEAPWLWAWDCEQYSYSHAYLIDIRGELGAIFIEDYAPVVFVLDRQEGAWGWKEVARLRGAGAHTHCLSLQNFRSCGTRTYVLMEWDIAVFDSQRLRWEWLKMATPNTDPGGDMFIWEPNLGVQVRVNTPSDQVKQTCASRIKNGVFTRPPVSSYSFSGVRRKFEQGMSWREIGKVCVDPNNGGVFRGKTEENPENFFFQSWMKDGKWRIGAPLSIHDKPRFCKCPM